jgi:hypothetical protein
VEAQRDVDQSQYQIPGMDNFQQQMMGGQGGMPG